MEWTIAFFFTLYISSFYVDLYPAIYTKPGADALRHPKRPDLGQPRRLEAGGDASASEELVDVYVGPAAMAEHRRRSQTPIWAQAPVTIGVARDGRLTQDSQRTLPVGLDLGRPATPKPARTPID